MNWLTKIFHRNEQIDREIDEELRFHIDTRIERYIQAGMTPEQARRKTLDRFGNFDEIRLAVREIDLGTIQSVWQDVRYAARTLAMSPGFTAVALASLALGIGLNSSIFSAINAVLLRPLPYKDSARILYIGQTYKEYGNMPAGMSPANYLDCEKQNHVFEAMAAIEPFHGRFGHLALMAGGEAEEIQTLRVSASFFQILGVRPALGRTFLPQEDKAGASVVVLGYELWHRRFGADPHVLGRDIKLNDASYRVIGVMPEGFRYLDTVGREAVDLWLPNPFAESSPTNRLMSTLRPIAQLKPEVTLAQARAEMEIIARRLTKEYPKENGSIGLGAVPLLEVVAGDARSPLLLL